VIVYCQTGGIGDAIMGTAVVSSLKECYGDVKVVHFEDLVQQVMPEAEKFPQEQLLNLADVGRHYPDASLAVINKFRKDNDGELSFFYALDKSMLPHVRRRRQVHLGWMHQLLNAKKPVSSLREFDHLQILQAMNREANYFADWQRYGLNTGYDRIKLPDSQRSIPAVSALGSFAIVHDSRLPGRSGDSSYVLKSWYTGRWSELCSRLVKKMPVIQVVGGDQKLFRDAIPHTAIIGENAVFSDYLDLLRQCRVYVGTDSWPAHAAICVEGPKFVILKGAVSRRWDHDSRFSRIIRVGGCQACEGPRGANSTCLWRSGSHECMDSITVDMVYNAVMEEIE